MTRFLLDTNACVRLLTGEAGHDCFLQGLERIVDPESLEISATTADGLIGVIGYKQMLRRITIDPEVMGGKPCIRSMRVTVGMIVEALAAGRTIEQLLADFPYLEEADIREALAFAAQLAQGHEVSLAG